MLALERGQPRLLDGVTKHDGRDKPGHHVHGNNSQR